MSKLNAKTDNGHITAELVRSVDAVLTSAAKHTYSASGVYGAHNQVFKLNETPDTCASCLRNRVDNLRRWYADYAMEQANKGLDQYGNKLTVVTSPAPKVSRETFDNLADLYSAYSTDSDAYNAYYNGNAPEDERALIESMLKTHNDNNEPNPLYPSEKELLNARLAELNTPVHIDTTNADGSFIVKDKDGNVHEVVYTEGEGDAPGKLTFTNEAGEVKSMKPGTYTVDNGDKYAVQPGGNTTFKPNDDIL